MDLSNYLPVLLFLFVGSLVGIGPMVIGKLLGPSRPDPEKLSAYECGFEAFGDARMQVDIRYYLVAILFILFDLEIAFLFPWAVSLGTIGFIGLVAPHVARMLVGEDQRYFLPTSMLTGAAFLSAASVPPAVSRPVVAHPDMAAISLTIPAEHPSGQPSIFS